MKKLLLILLLISNVAVADIGQVVAIKGKVTSNKVELNQGDYINIGDHLVSDKKSFAIFQFIDGAKVTLRPDSELYVEEYSYLEGNDKGRLDLISGGLRIVTGAIAKSDPEQYTLSTPVALMGVRGTEFSIQLLED